MHLPVQVTAIILVIAQRAAAQGTNYTNADFLTPPDWLAHGLVNSGGVGQKSIEPINVIVSARSDVDPFDVLTKIASFSNCFNLISVLQANVQPGRTSPVAQSVGLREGGCVQIFTGGNHLRAWPQTLPDGNTAFFIAASEEHTCNTEGGGPPADVLFSIPNNDFIAAASRTKGFTIYTQRVQLYNSGVGTDAGEGSSVDHIPYDGNVDIILVTRSTTRL